MQGSSKSSFGLWHQQVTGTRDCRAYMYRPASRDLACGAQCWAKEPPKRHGSSETECFIDANAGIEQEQNQRPRPALDAAVWREAKDAFNVVLVEQHDLALGRS
jgi:hypothetical protein